MQEELEKDYLNKDERSKLGNRESLMTINKAQSFKVSTSPFSIEIIPPEEKEDIKGILMGEQPKERELTAFEKHDLEFEKLRQNAVRNYGLNYEYMSDAQRMKKQRGGGIWWGDLINAAPLMSREKIELMEANTFTKNSPEQIKALLIGLGTGAAVWASIHIWSSPVPALLYLLFLYMASADLTSLMNIKDNVTTSKWWQLRKKKKELI